VFSHWNAEPATAGKAITVTLKVQDKNAGTVVIKWYRNLSLFSSPSQLLSHLSLAGLPLLVPMLLLLVVPPLLPFHLRQSSPTQPR